MTENSNMKNCDFPITASFPESQKEIKVLILKNTYLLFLKSLKRRRLTSLDIVEEWSLESCEILYNIKQFFKPGFLMLIFLNSCINI